MKHYLFFYMALALVTSCGKNTTKLLDSKAEVPVESLPFHQIELKDLSDFKSTSKNWQIVSDAVVDRSKKRSISGIEGTGVLLNNSDKTSKKHIFTNFDHGDIDLELDVMMPIGSNSGIYFQGRYEVQLFDSWNVKNPKYSDLGGIYQRWDKSREKGKQGYQGHSPKLNAAKAPGLWQKLKISFSAPKFNSAGDKVTNAKFNEVWLNGVLIHENIQVTGPTRATAFQDEKALGPIMIQGDHGPVAFKNIKYKLYKKQNISFSNLNFKEYNKTYKNKIPNLNMVKDIKNETVKYTSLGMLKSRNYKKTLYYSGELSVPETGEYLFNFKVQQGGIGLLLINKDTITSNIITLTKDEPVSFSLAISKTSASINQLEFSYEGPGVKKQSVDPKISISHKMMKRNKSMAISAKDGAIVQRSFLRHHGETRTHCISVGTPEGIHYAYDMNLGSLLSVWSGNDFFDATLMWTERGGEQFGRTGKFTLPMFGYSEFSSLEEENSSWISTNENTKFIGYDFDINGCPVFTNIIEGTTITNAFSPAKKGRGIVRTITIDGNKELFHKINEGETIKLLADGSYMINNDSYFIEFSKESSLKPFIRKSNGKEELLIKVPSGKQTINYTIIW